MSLQVTIPNEFEKIAPVNIGYTAGIETTKVAPEWIEKCNNIVDKVDQLIHIVVIAIIVDLAIEDMVKILIIHIQT